MCNNEANVMCNKALRKKKTQYFHGKYTLIYNHVIMRDLDIIKIRRDLGKTQLEFAEFLGVDRRTVINYEQGKKIPASRIKLLEMLLSNNEEYIHEIKNNRIPRKKEVVVETNESLHREILELKDHIKTLKDLIEEKNKSSEMYRNENILLKEKIDRIEPNSGG